MCQEKLQGYLAELPAKKRPKDFFAILLLLFNSLSWFYITRRAIYTTLNTLGATNYESLLIWGAYNLAIIGSSIAGAILSDKIKRSSIFYSWIFLGSIASSLPIFLPDVTFTSILSISLLWGISFGIGMPSCLAHFANCTVFENRGRTSGIVFFAISISAPLIIVLSNMNLQTISAISTVWRGVGLGMVPLLKLPDGIELEKAKHISLAKVLQYKSFLFYFVPWFMFSFIAGFEKLIFEHLLETDVYDFLRMVGAVFGSIFALIGGILSDFVGRKRIAIYGFISLGLAYAVVGIFPDSSLAWLLNRIVDGSAWGVFLAIFVLVLWGDLAPSGLGFPERYYAIGSIPLFFGDFIGSLFTPYIRVPASAAFSLASLFLFVAVLPLMYAPETLPKKVIEKRRLRKYLDDVKKVKKEYERDSSD